MNITRFICFIGIILLSVGIATAQPPTIDSAATAVNAKMEVYIKENIPFKEPIPRVYVREADVLWETTVWRLVDLRQRQNMPLYFPVNPKRIGSRVNFFTLLMEAVERGEITAYDPFSTGDEFAATQIRTFQQIAENPSLRSPPREVNEMSIITGRDTSYMVPGFNALLERECTRLLIKEKIYFDKRHSTMQFEVIGIQPIFNFDRVIEGTDETQQANVNVMWVYYPEIRPLLARHEVYNDFNEAQSISFDDFFMQHRYDGMIVRQGNVRNNRDIREYMSGVRALYEAQDIETKIFNWEQDLWEY
jgi:gliding motility associated protien GldN